MELFLLVGQIAQETKMTFSTHQPARVLLRLPAFCWKHTERYSPSPDGCTQSWWSADMFVLERKWILSTQTQNLEMLGEFGKGGQYFDYSLVESKAFWCWVDGQPWHTKSSLVVQDNILQKPPVTGRFLLKRADTGWNSWRGQFNTI